MTKVLVVDDNKSDRMVLSEVFAAKGYDVTEAGNGIEALESVEASKPGGGSTFHFTLPVREKDTST